MTLTSQAAKRRMQSGIAVGLTGGLRASLRLVVVGDPAVQVGIVKRLIYINQFNWVM